MAVLARATRRAIEGSKREEIRAHFEFVNELFANAPPDLENTICVSYLENVFLDRSEAYASACSMLSPRLQQALTDLEAHWDLMDRPQPEI